MRSWQSEEKAEQCDLVNMFEIDVKCQSFLLKRQASDRQLWGVGTEGRDISEQSLSERPH